MTRYLPDYRKLIICIISIVISNLGLYFIMRNSLVHFFNGLIPVDFNENLVMVIIMVTIWLIPYFYFYIKSLNSIAKYFVECESYFMIKTHSVLKLFYFIIARLIIEIIIINSVACIIGIVFGYQFSFLEVFGNILRMVLAISIMMGVGLFKKYISEYMVVVFGGLYILSIVFNMYNRPNILTCLFLNDGNTWLLDLLIVVLIVIVHITIIQLYKRVDF